MTENYENYLTQPGTAVSLADAGRFDWHRRICPVCSVSRYAYTRCPEGQRLARRMVTPAVQQGESPTDGTNAGEEPARLSALGLQSQPEPLPEEVAADAEWLADYDIAFPNDRKGGVGVMASVRSKAQRLPRFLRLRFWLIDLCYEAIWQLEPYRPTDT